VVGGHVGGFVGDEEDFRGGEGGVVVDFHFFVSCVFFSSSNFLVCSMGNS
jgi:hypothetical protein